MIKTVNRNFVKGILFLFMIFSFIVHSKTRIDGSININWGRKRSGL